jgi:hypothetical protein
MLQVRTFRFVEPLWGRPKFEEIAGQLGFLGPPQLTSRRQ